MTQFFISCQESRIEHARSFYGCFYIGPFNTNQSLTVANALRRTLLSELNGIAITSVEIQGAVHEYSTLPGIRDSVLDIVLNLKQIVLKSSFPLTKPMTGYLQATGPGIVRASDLKLPLSIQCVDPDQYIASLSPDGFLNIKFIIHQGKNYIVQDSQLAKNTNRPDIFNSFDVLISDNTKYNDRTNINNLSTKPIFIDAVFTPINKVNYIIENRIQKEKTFLNNIIILEVWTNGSIYPRQAVYDALKTLMYLFSELEKMKILNGLFTNQLLKSNKHADQLFKKIEYEYEYYTDFQRALTKSKTKDKLSTKAVLEFEKKYKQEMFNEKELKQIQIGNLNISNRCRKLLQNAQLYNVNDLIKNPKIKLSSIKGFGKKCLEEIKNALEQIGLDFVSEIQK